MSKPRETVETVMAKCASTMDALLAGEIEPEQAHRTADEVEQLIREQRAEQHRLQSTSA